MHQELRNKDGSLKHSLRCIMAFGRKDKECPRCIEMLNGSPARSGWQKDYYSQKILDEKKRVEAIKNHNCDKYGCLSVCVAFDY